jgi:hypothetical protein
MVQKSADMGKVQATLLIVVVTEHPKSCCHSTTN